MKKPDAAARAAAMIERRDNTLREMSENPELAKGAVGTIVFDLMKAGEEVSLQAIIEEMEAAAAGRSSRSDLPEVLAKGALKVITDLKP